MPTVLWFRRDLRVHDLPALIDAAAAGGARTMAKDLDGPGHSPQAYLRELAFRDFYASVLFA